MNLLQPPLDVQRLAGLVFELSSQLHKERLQRLALETALVRAGLLDADACERLAADPVLAEKSRHAAEQSVAGLMRVLGESPDERTPLRTSRPTAPRGT